MITFGAKYLSSTTLQRYKTPYSEPVYAHFAELNPKNQADKAAMRKVVSIWGRKTEYSKDIFESFNFYSQMRGKNSLTRFFVLTKQNILLTKLKPKDILGIAEVTLMGSDKKTAVINYLQVLTDKNVNEPTRGVTHIGTGILNCIKNVFRGKELELDAVETAVNFYEKNGFVIEEKSPVLKNTDGKEYFKMVYSNLLKHV